MPEPDTAACPRCGGFDHELCSSDGRAVRVPTTTTTAAAELQGPTVDPWDETPVTVPRGLLSVLLHAADKADAAQLLGAECASDPCPVCTALVEVYDAVYPND